MQTRAEWVVRNLRWSKPGRGTTLDHLLLSAAQMNTYVQPSIDGGLIDHWQLQDLVMCPSGGVIRAQVVTTGFEIAARHPTLIQGAYGNSCQIKKDATGAFFLFT